MTMKPLALLMFALSLLVAPATAIAAAETPTGLVEALYARDGAFAVEDEDLPEFYSADLSAAIAADRKDEVGAIDFDWLYAAQDMDLGPMTFTELSRSADSAVVEARFTNFGKLTLINWSLCRRESGDWRVADVRYLDVWTLRCLLQLPQTPNC
jgi:hypothetical protein